MKNLKYLVVILFALSGTATLAQSESFESLTDRFSEDKDVYSFKINGFLCRTVLWMAGEWEFKDAISDVKNIRIITIPKENFRQKELSIIGFRNFLKADHFESLMSIKDKGDKVEIYIQQSDNRKDRYLVLVEEPADVTVIELKGCIDIQKLREMDKGLSYQNR